MKFKFSFPRHFPQITKIKSIYWFFISILSTGIFLRCYWASPNVLLLSHFWIIDDVEAFLNRRFSDVKWFDVGTSDFSMSGWRLLTFLNASIFGWNSNVDLFFYLLVSLSIIFLSNKYLQNWSASFTFYARVPIALVIFNLAGFGAKGMEIGQFIGLALLIFALSLSINADKSSRLVDLIVVDFPIFLAIFMFSGGYALSFTISVLFVSFLTYLCNKNAYTLSRLVRFSFSIALQTLFYSIAYLYNHDFKLNAITVSENSHSIFQHIFYLARYVFYSASASVFSSHTLEKIDSQDIPIVLIFLSIFIWIIYLAAFLYAVKNIKINSALSFPLVLLLYSPLTALIVGNFRRTSDFGFLSPWYILHAKMALLGSILILIPILYEKRKRFIAFSMSIVLFVSIFFASLIQWNRHPFERAWFQNIQRASLFPEMYQYANNSNTSPIFTSDKEYMKRLDQMRRLNLGVFSNSENTIETLLLKDKYFLRFGDYYDDDWLGINGSILFLENNCKKFELELTPIKLYSEISINFNSDFLVSNYSFENVSSVRETFAISYFPARLDFKSIGAVRPSSIYKSPDSRELSVKIHIRCASTKLLK